MTEDASHRLTRVTPFVGGRDKTDSDPVHPIHVVCSLSYVCAPSSNALFVEGLLIRVARSLSSAPILRYLSAQVSI